MDSNVCVCVCVCVCKALQCGDILTLTGTQMMQIVKSATARLVIKMLVMLVFGQVLQCRPDDQHVSCKQRRYLFILDQVRLAGRENENRDQNYNRCCKTAYNYYMVRVPLTQHADQKS